jgi:hypothetical protein
MPSPNPNESKDLKEAMHSLIPQLIRDYGKDHAIVALAEQLYSNPSDTDLRRTFNEEMQKLKSK